MAPIGREISNRVSTQDRDLFRNNLLKHLQDEYQKRRETRYQKQESAQHWELYAKQNADRHNTSQYDLVEDNNPAFIIRRGQTFYIAIRLPRTPDLDREKIKLEFSFGPNPQIIKGTKVNLPLSPNSSFVHDSSRWDVKTVHQNKTVISIEVQVPPTVSVGAWKMAVAGVWNDGTTFRMTCPDYVYILFNPWCKGDMVYLWNQLEREEYVLNETGKVFVGSYSKPKGRRWVYGQFLDSVLPACLYLLELSQLDSIGRSSPIRVVRAISAMINSQDDNGVVVGNWSGDYEEGRAPWTWTGSGAILEEFLRTDGTPVKFGQCWVFAGVATTVCRALGIPCRTVTNFVSAHDTDESLTIDKYFDKKGDQLDRTSDSIWNFHVWNDCWMSRPDLPKGYGGWQAFDATPQETSEGVYRAGPASLEAIRKGEIGFLYDSPFIFSEVNADLVHWQEDETDFRGWKRLKTNKYHIGRCILTKKPGIDDDKGDRDSENILSQYKNPEGTEEERMAILNAAKSSGLQYLHDMPDPEKEDVLFDLLEIDRIMIGEPFNVSVVVKNNSDQVRSVSALLVANTVHYTGLIAKKVKSENAKFILRPKQKETLHLTIKPSEYLDKLVEYSLMKIYAQAKVKETLQAWSEEDDFVVEKPALKIKTPAKIKVGTPFQIEIHFTNPLKTLLRYNSFTIEGPGLQEPKQLAFRDIKPQESIIFTENLMPKRAGERKLVAVFNSEQLIEVLGSQQVNVLP